MPVSPKKHPTALSPLLPFPAPGLWLWSSAATFLPGPPRAWTPRYRSARLWGQVWSRSRLLLEEATRERGLAGAWEAGISLLCPAASQKRDPRHRKVPVAAGEQSTTRATGGENEQGNVLFCVGFRRTESRSSSPAGERVYMTETCPCSPTCIPSGSLKERVKQQTGSRGIFR